MTVRPVISVITVVKNGAQTIEETIQSVAGQSCPQIEYIVVDGASTDGTLEILRKYEAHLAWFSEPDLGIYDAMNKGIKMATGRWFYFLGANDRIHSHDTLARVLPALDERLSLVCGAVVYPDGRKVTSRLGLRTLLHNTVHHQGAFYSARLFDNWSYDRQFKIAADYELNLLIYLEKMAFSVVGEVVAVCGDEGVSLVNCRQAHDEVNAVRGKVLGLGKNLLATFLFTAQCAVERFVRICRGRPV